MAENIKERIVQELISLSLEDIRDVMCTVAEVNPHQDAMQYVTNKFQKVKKEDKSQKRPSASGEVTMFTKPPTPKLKEGRIGNEGSSRADGRSQSASLLPDLHGVSAWKVPVVFRGDLVPKNGLVFIDVKKVSMNTGWGHGVVPYGTKKKHRQVAVNVAVVDDNGSLILWAFINRGTERICQYFSSIHGINKTKLKTGISMEFFRELLEKCIQTNTIVGAKIRDDLKSLSTEKRFVTGKLFNHPKNIDFQDFLVDSNSDPIKLKDLVQHFNLNNGKRFQEGVHSSISDARMTMKLYMKMCEMKSLDATLTSTRSICIKRTPRAKYAFSKLEMCKCLEKAVNV